MELSEYIRIIRTKFIYIVLAAVVAGGISYFLHSRQTEMYKAEATVLIGGFIQSPNPNSGDIRTGMDLALTYSELVESHKIVTAASEQLNGEVSPGGIRRMLTAEVVENTSLLKLTATSENPELAAAVANAVAEQLVENSPSNLTPDQLRQVDFISAQIDRLTTQLANYQTELVIIEERINATTNAQDAAGLNVQRNWLIEQTTQLWDTIARFTNTISDLQQRTNYIEIMDSAQVPSTPSGTTTRTITMLGAMIGAVLALLVTLLLNSLDSTFHTADEAVHTTDLPLLGAVQDFFHRPLSGLVHLIRGNNRLGYVDVPQDYHSVAARLALRAGSARQNTYLITSPGSREGKTTTAVNLAIAIAQEGRRVLLVDADLHRPHIHEVFNLSNEHGLAELLSPILADGEDSGNMAELFAASVLETPISNLFVIPAGTARLHPTLILGSARADEFWALVNQKANMIDVVLIDSAPVQVGADTLVTAVRSRAGVILVIAAHKTPRGAIAQAKAAFAGTGVQLKGLVFNKANPADEHYARKYASDSRRSLDGYVEAPWAANGPVDDLSLIHDISPRLAIVLYSVGITSFVDLASYTPEELSDKLKDHVYIRPSRIQRNDWIGQAKRFANAAQLAGPVEWS